MKNLALFGHFSLEGRLEMLELVEGAVEGALDAGFVAAETPGGHDDSLDPESLDGADGFQFVLEGLAGFVEFVHVSVPAIRVDLLLGRR